MVFMDLNAFADFGADPISLREPLQTVAQLGRRATGWAGPKGSSRAEADHWPKTPVPIRSLRFSSFP